MKNTDIKKMYFANNGVVALYKGNDLIWRKNDSVANIITGVWSDSPSTSNSDYNDKPYIIYNEVRHENLPISEDKSFIYNSTDELTDASYMFANSIKDEGGRTLGNNYNLTKLDLSQLDTSSVNNMSSMFHRCSYLNNITGLSDLDVSNVITFDSMFEGCISLVNIDISNWNIMETSIKSNTTPITSMHNLCYGCRELTRFKFPNYQINNYYNGGGVSEGMFCNCRKLEIIDNMKMYFRWNVGQCFGWCYKLKALNNIDWNFYDIHNCRNIFYACQSLTTITGTIKNINFNIDIRYSPLTNASAMVFLNGLADVEETKTITFKSTTYSTLSEEQIAVATSKGWSVVSA